MKNSVTNSIAAFGLGTIGKQILKSVLGATNVHTWFRISCSNF
jgi:hypothetical protein